MELINATRMVAGYTMGMEPSGRELLVVVIKGTFHLPRTAGEPLRLPEEQLPLIMADTFTGEPGLSAPVHEVDFAPRKKRVRCAAERQRLCPRWPPGQPGAGRPAGQRHDQELRRGRATACWRPASAGISASDPEPFTVMPISYDRAFGGVDNKHEDPAKHAAFMRNPVGRGFHKHLRSEWVDGTPLPNTEELNRPVTSTDDDYAPMAFGPIGRGWEPRYRYAGTYDQTSGSTSTSPSCRQISTSSTTRPRRWTSRSRGRLGGQEVALVNLTPDGRRSFTPAHLRGTGAYFSQKGRARGLTWPRWIPLCWSPTRNA